VQTQHLTPEQQQMLTLWEQHMAAEFGAKSIDATMATMTDRPFVNHVPVMTGGVGREEVRHFYGTYFIPGHPPDIQVVPVARTIGETRLVDEMICSFTHTIEMQWLLPGVAPTGRFVELPVIVVVEFENGKIAGERIYWDQASVLVQIGLIDGDKLPVTGATASRKVVDPAREPSNQLIQRWA
jgi:carboxymethylenebutenolidase